MAENTEAETINPEQRDGSRNLSLSSSDDTLGGYQLEESNIEEDTASNTTHFEPEHYKAAVEGNPNEFTDKDIKSLRTPNRNTILHIHLISSTTTTETTSPQGLLGNIIQGMFRTPQKAVHRPVSEQFVRNILDRCSDLVAEPNSMGETPLHMAARYGHTAIAKLLIERAKAVILEREGGITMEKRLIRAQTKRSGDTALHEAVRHDHVGVVGLLLDQKDTELSNMANKAKETPLYLAALRQHRSIVQEILKKESSPAYGGPWRLTALHISFINSDQGIVEELLKYKHVAAAVEHRDKDKRVPLHYAVEMGNKSLTELLLKKNKNTAYKRDGLGMTPLNIAAKNGHLPIMEMIIKYCPDCSEIVDEKGNNILHCAVDAQHHLVVARIMSDLSLSNLYNEKNDDGNTPLHCLAKSRISGKDLIIHPRVDKQAVNNEYNTALDLAYDTVKFSPLRKQGIIYRLEKAGAKRSLGAIMNSMVEPKKQHKMLEFTKEAKESHLIVVTLIATVTFAAAFTLPGGNYQDGELKGSPILRDKASFKAFLVSNTIAMVMATSAAFIHLFSPFRNKADWLEYYFSEAAFSFTVVAIATMVVAFATGMYAVLGSSSIGIVAITIGLLFFLVFRQVLRMGFGACSLVTFLKNIANVTLFSFIRFSSKPFGFFSLLFRRSSLSSSSVNPKRRETMTIAV